MTFPQRRLRANIIYALGLLHTLLVYSPLVAPAAIWQNGTELSIALQESDCAIPDCWCFHSTRLPCFPIVHSYSGKTRHCISPKAKRLFFGVLSFCRKNVENFHPFKINYL